MQCKNITPLMISDALQKHCTSFSSQQTPNQTINSKLENKIIKPKPGNWEFINQLLTGYVIIIFHLPNILYLIPKEFLRYKTRSGKSKRKEYIGTWNEPWELNVVISKLVCYHWQALFTSYLDCFRKLELFKPYNNLNELVELLINECNRKLNDNTNKIFTSN